VRSCGAARVAVPMPPLGQPRLDSRTAAQMLFKRSRSIVGDTVVVVGLIIGSSAR